MCRVLTFPSPFVSFDSINRNGTRLAKVLSLEDFQRDVKGNTLPQYAHISPNLDNDGHDTGLQFGTSWIRTFLTPLLANEQFMDRTLILLTYDESERYNLPNHIVSVLLGGSVPQEMRGTKEDTFYTHYSILSTLENNWDLPNLGRYDVGANVFKLVADQTGYANHPPSNRALINCSLSYAGFMNNLLGMSAAIPPPNLKLIGAGGKGVHASVDAAWSIMSNELTPYDGSGNVYDGGDGVTNKNAPVYKAQAPASS